MKMKKNSKLPLKILSAFAAIVLWFAITYTEDPIITQALTDISLVFEGEADLHDKGLILVNKEKLPALTAQIRGNRSSVITSVGAVSATVNVSELSETGENTVPIKYSYPSQSVTLTKTRYKEITLEAEKLVERTVPVRIETANDDKNALYITASKSEVSTVSVLGAESVVYKIAYAKTVVDTSDITASSTQTMLYKLYDSKGNVLSENNILSKSTATLPVENTVYNKVSLPVNVVLAPEMQEDFALKIKDQSVTSVYAGVPESVSVTALEAVFDGKTSPDKTEYELTITVPEGIYLPESDKKLTVKCELIPKVVRDVELVPTTISPLSVTDHEALSKKVVFTPEKLKVTVKGTEDILTAQNIKAVVDIKDIISGGEATLPVQIEAQEGITVIGEYTILGSLDEKK